VRLTYASPVAAFRFGREDIVTKLSRILVAIGAVLLLGVFIFPLWRVNLIAPQYPEGLGMLIRVNTVTGIKPNDLENINGLNHYIGMKAIEPDAIPELEYMPWIVAGLSAFGLVAAALGRRRVVFAWLAAFAVLAVVGLYDFWRWEYDYGHNLDLEHAIIKIPGMTYQPPLIGTKQLLNFTAASWPALGAVCVGVAFLLGVAALVVVRRSSAQMRRASAAVAVAATAAACAPREPGRIADVGRTCDYCRMTIADERFGGQIITAKGKVYAFDAIECLASFYLQQPAAGEGGTVWVADFANPGHWLAAKSALFARSEAHQSPMGLNLVSFAPNADAATLPSDVRGATMQWAQVLALVQREWSAKPLAAAVDDHGR
jgi:copper chaperone NosL